MIITSSEQLPDLRGSRELFLDFETTSFDVTRGAIDPYNGDRVCGVCVTADDNPTAYYVPIRHQLDEDRPLNLNPDGVMRWVGDIIKTSDEWINHNVKFDAHFAGVEGHEFGGRLVDTLTLAKLLDSDRTFKGGYGLKTLSEAWLEHDISMYEDGVKTYLNGIKLPRNRKAKDYGHVPVQIMGQYGKQDVLTNRELWRYLQRRRPDDMAQVWETEILLTPVLYDIECEGMQVDNTELKVAEFKTLSRMTTIEEKIHSETGLTVTPSNSNHCFDLLCNTYGLPVLALNDNGNPSFDKDAIKQYAVHPSVLAHEDRTRVVNMILEYRTLQTLLTLFIQPYQEYNVDGRLHTAYNQSVSSGRMSSRRPNAQQLSKAAKRLIHPGEGRAFLSCDYSQIEFRLIVHYTRALDAIAAYQEDPYTDFHTWVAEMCGIPRRPAKNVNFAIGYGAGKRKVTTMLASNMELMEGLKSRLNDFPEHQRQSAFQRMCQQRAEEVFWKYHEALPGLRPTTRQAARKIESRGYVRNAYGRRAHLSQKAAHIAFNRLVQGCAADIMKERTVAVAPRYNSDTRKFGLSIAASVHDETLFVGDIEATRDPAAIRHVVDTLEAPVADFSVPIKTGVGWSDIDWATASGDDGVLDRSFYAL